MEVTNEEVDVGKREPGEIETGSEHDHTVGPGGVQQGGVQVREVLPLLFGDVLVIYARFSTFHDNSLHFVHCSFFISFRHVIF